MLQQMEVLVRILVLLMLAAALWNLGECEETMERLSPAPVARSGMFSRHGETLSWLLQRELLQLLASFLEYITDFHFFLELFGLSSTHVLIVANILHSVLRLRVCQAVSHGNRSMGLSSWRGSCICAYSRAWKSLYGPNLPH